VPAHSDLPPTVDVVSCRYIESGPRTTAEPMPTTIIRLALLEG
jgi:hypothetical protein